MVFVLKTDKIGYRNSINLPFRKSLFIIRECAEYSIYKSEGGGNPMTRCRQIFCCMIAVLLVFAFSPLPAHAQKEKIRVGYYEDGDYMSPVSYTHLTLPTNREV